jgi:yecA family protein
VEGAIANWPNDNAVLPMLSAYGFTYLAANRGRTPESNTQGLLLASTCYAILVAWIDDMADPLPLSGPIDLDALDDYLLSDRAPEDCMGLSDLDGFLTGIVVGPELILPSEWLPVIWGGEEPVFQTEDEMRAVLGTIMGRYDEIVACLDTDPDDFDPILLEGPEGEVIASDWAGGFIDAVALRPTAWKPLIESDGAGILMVPLFALNGDLGGGPDGMTSVIGIYDFWRNYRKPS